MTRVKIPEHKKFRKNMNICVTEKQLKDIEKRAFEKEISLSSYVRGELFK